MNTNIQNGKISVIHWNKKMLFENDHNIVVLKDNLLLIEESTIKNIILSQMNLIDKFSVLTTALKNTGLLHCTKGQRYTSTMYRNGSPFRTDLFAVLADDILESNVFSMISSVNDTAFLTIIIAHQIYCHLFKISTNYQLANLLMLIITVIFCIRKKWLW